MNIAQIGIIPHKNPHTPLKAETPAAGETLQRLGGGGGEKSKRLSYLRFKALFLAKRTTIPPSERKLHRSRLTR